MILTVIDFHEWDKILTFILDFVIEIERDYLIVLHIHIVADKINGMKGLDPTAHVFVLMHGLNPVKKLIFERNIGCW